jgi:arylsulfatase
MQARIVATLLFSMVLASCADGPDDAPRWIRLAERAGALTPVGAQRVPGAKDREVTVTTDANEARVTFEFRASDWRRGREGLWGATLPASSLSLRGRMVAAQLAPDDPIHEPSIEGAAPYRLRDELGEYELWVEDDPRRTPELPPRSFTVAGPRIFVSPAGEAPPERLVLEVRENRGPVEEGARRFLGNRFSGEGLVVWPGEELTLTLELPPGSALTFGLATEPRLHHAFEPGGELAYRIELDGEQLFEERFASAEPDLRWRSVALPDAGGSARLSFSVRGPFARTAFLAPTVGPRARGTPGARPWGRARPDVIVFLADTFRADNLAVYGGRAELAPFVNELASRSLVFTRAWSTAPYTLAAHASLFTGFYPRQAGILDQASALPRELFTLAEYFAVLGYRTGAVTDQGFVSRTFGMDQGFQSFDEAKGKLPETAERVRAFLEADDGRPLFLFVQTYRTHATYEASSEACAALGLQPVSTAELATYDEEYDRLAARAERAPEDQLRMTELARALERHYRATVWDLDRGFERIFRELEARGHFANGFLVFTSDHGEAFGEHGELFHGMSVNEEELRIPLFLHGPGLRAGLVERPVSLLDLPRTLAELVGAEPRKDWLGSSILALAENRPIYGFQCSRKLERSSELCVIDLGRKVIGLEDVVHQRAEGPRSAFDLARDPGELQDLAAESWPRIVFERHRPLLEAALRPLVAPTSAAPTAEQLESLSDMGYVGGDE